MHKPDQSIPNEFQRTLDMQQRLAGHIRNPAKVAAPEGIEPRRLKIYRDLIFKNVESFLSGGFPVLRSLYTDSNWTLLVQDFLDQHVCHTPYFLEISEEFLSYLQQRDAVGDPAFLFELAHYEWVELALSVSTVQFEGKVNPLGDMLTGIPVMSPQAWPLSYTFPVQLISEQYQPQAAAAEPVFLLVYRDPDDDVQFMALNAVTAQLLSLIQQQDLGAGNLQTGEQLLRQLATGFGLDVESIRPHAMALMQDLRCKGVMLGCLLSS